MQPKNRLKPAGFRSVQIIAMLVLFVCQSATIEAGVQYRESDIDFLSKLAARLDAVESSATELETELDTFRPADSGQERGIIQNIKATPNARKASAVIAKPATEPDDGGYQRVSERLRHKQRAVNADQDELNRVKVKFPLLRESIASARKHLLAHELTHTVQQRSGTQDRQTLLENAKQAVSEVEAELTGLAAEIGTLKSR